MNYKCEVCHDSGSKNQTGDYLDCPACDMPHTRKALNDFVKSLGPTHPEDVALAIHQRALAMAPKQESPRQWVAIKDSEWANIVNHGRAYDGWDKNDIINHVFKLTQAKCKELNGPDAAPAAANGALTDEQILIIRDTSSHSEMERVRRMLSPGEANIAFARAILAAAGPDAALVKALESALAIINNEADPDEYAAPLKLIRASISGAKGN